MSNPRISYFNYESYFGKSAYSKLSVFPEYLNPVVLQDNLDIAYDFHNDLDRNKSESGLIPPGLRLSIPGFVVFERPPTRKLVDYIDYSVSEMSEGQYDEDSDETHYLEQHDLDDASCCYDVPVPWQIYMVAYSTNPASMYTVTYVRMYFSNTSLNDPNTVLYMPYVNNFFTDGSMCNPMFEDYGEISRYPRSLEGVIASAYDFIWNTGFNRDLYECVDQTINLCYHNTNNQIIKNAVDKKLLFAGRHKYFYKLLSEHSVEEVVAEQWANPSYTQHYQRDREFLHRYSNKYHNLYYDACGKNDPDSKFIDSEQHYFSIIGKPELIKKTYMDIIEYMFYDSESMRHSPIDYYKLLKTPVPQLRDFSSYVNTLSHHITASPCYNKSLQNLVPAT